MSHHNIPLVNVNSVIIKRYFIIYLYSFLSASFMKSAVKPKEGTMTSWKKNFINYKIFREKIMFESVTKQYRPIHNTFSDIYTKTQVWIYIVSFVVLCATSQLMFIRWLHSIQCFPLFIFSLLETTLKVWLLQLILSYITWWEHVLPQVTVLPGPDCHHLLNLHNNLLSVFGWILSELKIGLLSILFLVGDQAPDKEWGGSLFGDLFPGGARWLGSWHHGCGRQAADGWR